MFMLLCNSLAKCRKKRLSRVKKYKRCKFPSFTRKQMLLKQEQPNITITAGMTRLTCFHKKQVDVLQQQFNVFGRL